MRRRGVEATREAGVDTAPCGVASDQPSGPEGGSSPYEQKTDHWLLQLPVDSCTFNQREVEDGAAFVGSSRQNKRVQDGGFIQTLKY